MAVVPFDLYKVNVRSLLALKKAQWTLDAVYPCDGMAPLDLAIGANGFLYVTVPESGQVRVLNTQDTSKKGTTFVYTQKNKFRENTRKIFFRFFEASRQVGFQTASKRDLSLRS